MSYNLSRLPVKLQIKFAYFCAKKVIHLIKNPNILRKANKCLSLTLMYIKNDPKFNASDARNAYDAIYDATYDAACDVAHAAAHAACGAVICACAYNATFATTSATTSAAARATARASTALNVKPEVLLEEFLNSLTKLQKFIYNQEEKC